MGHPGQVHTKTSTAEQRVWMGDLVQALGMDAGALQPAQEKDDEGRRVSVTAHVDWTERKDIDERAEVYGVTTATLARLYLRLGQSLVTQIEAQWDDEDEARSD